MIFFDSFRRCLKKLVFFHQKTIITLSNHQKNSLIYAIDAKYGSVRHCSHFGALMPRFDSNILDDDESSRVFFFSKLRVMLIYYLAFVYYSNSLNESLLLGKISSDPSNRNRKAMSCASATHRCTPITEDDSSSKNPTSKSSQNGNDVYGKCREKKIFTVFLLFIFFFIFHFGVKFFHEKI